MQLKRRVLLITGGIILAAALIFSLAARRTVTLVINGETRSVLTAAPTVGWILRDAGITLSSADEVSPAASTWLGAETTIQIKKVAQVQVWHNGLLTPPIFTTERRPAELIKLSGITPATADRILWNGRSVSAQDTLPEQAAYVLQVLPALSLNILEGSATRQITSTAASLGQALWDNGLQLSPGDSLSLPFSASWQTDNSLVLLRARPVTITVEGRTLTAHTAAATVGQALAETGVALQGLDYSQPAEDRPIPADGKLRVVRVREETVLSQTSLPFKVEYVTDAQTELDQTRVLTPGQSGLKVTRQRVRFEDGKETLRLTENEWVASEPKVQKNAYGTKIVIRTLNTPSGTIEYYRTARVYATSMAPCKFIPFIGKCSYNTAYGLKLQKGIIGTGPAWYNLFAGQRMYVEGYGTGVVADYGYVPGFWLDLGFSDDDFVAWHSYTTIYFQTPVPKNVPWILPP